MRAPSSLNTYLNCLSSVAWSSWSSEKCEDDDVVAGDDDDDEDEDEGAYFFFVTVISRLISSLTRAAAGLPVF